MSSLFPLPGKQKLPFSEVKALKDQTITTLVNVYLDLVVFTRIAGTS